MIANASDASWNCFEVLMRVRFEIFDIPEDAKSRAELLANNKGIQVKINSSVPSRVVSLRKGRLFKVNQE